ncbi:MAG: GNAT family N-acetyltransferase [Granulosicoccus sp.]|nr:GNAT family N-acetyltransferase [Granulosicoccus sp.]
MSTLHLDKLLDPDSVVVIGASDREGSPGKQLTRNLIDGGYQGDLWLVNPRYSSVQGQPCHRSLKALPSTPDLALILTPDRLIEKTLLRCAQKGIRVAVVMSASTQSDSVHQFARKLGIRILGPHCAGLIRPHKRLNATYNLNRINSGSLAIVSQSAMLCAAVLDWAESRHIGFSALLSTGNNADIDLSDLIDLLAEDVQTKAIIVYTDHVKNARSRLSALSAAARAKPVVLMRSAQDVASYCDALTRTGVEYSSDVVFQAALNRAGVVRIRTFENLFAAAQILASGTRVSGHRMGIISNGLAPAMLAFERMKSKQFSVPQFTQNELAPVYEATNNAVHGRNPLVLRNPVKLAAHYCHCITQLCARQDLDVVLIIFVPDSRNDPEELAQAVAQLMPLKKPVLACWMGESTVARARELLTDAGLPAFNTPESSIDGFDFLHRYWISQQQLLQLPNPASRTTPADLPTASRLVADALQTGHRVLDTSTTISLLQAFDISVIATRAATTIDSALSHAKELGYPVAMRLVSPSIIDNASILPTQLGVDSAQAVTKTWNTFKQRLQERRPDAEFAGVLIQPMYTPNNPRYLALSLSRDCTFGPVLSIGMGGELTPQIRQTAVQFPPLNRFLIDEMLQEPMLSRYMGAYRHTPAVDTSQLGQVLRRLSELACELPDVFSLELDPLVVSAEGVQVLNCHCVIERSSIKKRYAHLAIHPYPWQWVRQFKLKNSAQITLRPIRPEDAKGLAALVDGMSAESRYLRFMHAIDTLPPRMLAQFTKLDYDRQMALVAVDQQQSVIGVSRYVIQSNRRVGEFAVGVGEQWKGLGLASTLMRLLIEHAAEQGLQSLQGDVLHVNYPMQGLMKSLGFRIDKQSEQADIIRYSYDLSTGSS